MPVLNAQDNVAEQMAALAGQRYPGRWELVVVDNGCTDATMAVVESWREHVPSLRIAQAGQARGVTRARRAGADAAEGDFLAFCDADDVVAPNWLDALTDAATRADLVTGALDFDALNDGRRQAWRGNLRPQDGLLSVGEYRFLPFASFSNCGMWAEVLERLGWDLSFRSGGADIEFSWRAHLAGYDIAAVPSAIVHYRFRVTLPAMIKQHLGYGASEPHLYRLFRASGMPRRSVAESRDTWLWLARILPSALRGREFGGNWLRVLALSLGRMWGSLRWRVLYL
jgi:glycosyltransferase involved in cell wall biosynthesis